MLDTLNQGFKNLRHRMQGLEELTEARIDEVLGDVRRSLLEADVALPVVKGFLERVRAKALGEVVQVRVRHQGQRRTISAADAFLKICEDELVALLGPVDTRIRFRGAGPTTIMLVGLQGSGKTTTAGKLASLLVRRNQRQPLLVAADVYRPAAVDQLQVIGRQLDLPVFTGSGADPVAICREAVAEAGRAGRDTVILDTAGRLAIDEPLMQELEAIKKAVRPDHIYLVCDAMIGQDAVRMSSEFHRRLDVDGFIMTKLDGDTRGGSTLSVKEVTGRPVKFVGMGEGLDRLEEFRPEGMASRILGFGDIVGLVRDFEEVVDQKKAEEDAERMLQGQFTLADYLEQIRNLRKMGPLQEVMEKIPGMSEALPTGAQFDDRALVVAESMIQSMTPDERRRPQIINQSRAARIARGCGRRPHEIRNLIGQHGQMRKLMSALGGGGGGGLMGKVPGLRQLSQMNQMRKLMAGGEGEGESGGLGDLLAGLRGRKPALAPSKTPALNKDQWRKEKNKRKAERRARKGPGKKK